MSRRVVGIDRGSPAPVERWDPGAPPAVLEEVVMSETQEVVARWAEMK
jgi:hypothetical protein